MSLARGTNLGHQTRAKELSFDRVSRGQLRDDNKRIMAVDKAFQLRIN